MAREMRVIRNVPILEVGTWQASSEWTVTRAHIYAAVNSLKDPAVRLPRIWIGHDDERDEPASDKGGPAVGWMSNLQAIDDGDTLAADMHVPPLLAETMHAHFPGRSGEFWENVTTATGITHLLTVDGVALLGRELPAVETLEDIAELWGMTPSREDVPVDAPKIAASRRLIVCALGRNTPAPAGPDNPRTEGHMPNPAPTGATPAPDPKVEPGTPEPTNTDPAAVTPPEGDPAAEPTKTPAKPAEPSKLTLDDLPDHLVVMDKAKVAEYDAGMEQLGKLLKKAAEQEADAFAEELVDDRKIAAKAKPKYAAEYLENPEATRRICDLMPKGVVEAPPTGRIAATRGDDTDPTAIPSLITYTEAEKARLGIKEA